MGRYDRLHGDEPEIEAKERELSELLWESLGNDYKEFKNDLDN